LIGALHSVQEGRIEVLGHDLSTLGRCELITIRRNIAFILQMHNFSDALPTHENLMATQPGG
jgi:putative ABC transport system ATP-binding protein